MGETAQNNRHRGNRTNKHTTNVTGQTDINYDLLAAGGMARMRQVAVRVLRLGMKGFYVKVLYVLSGLLHVLPCFVYVPNILPALLTCILLVPYTRLLFCHFSLALFTLNVLQLRAKRPCSNTHLVPMMWVSRRGDHDCVRLDPLTGGAPIRQEVANYFLLSPVIPSAVSGSHHRQ